MNEGAAGLRLRDWLPARLRQLAVTVAFDLAGIAAGSAR